MKSVFDPTYTDDETTVADGKMVRNAGVGLVIEEVDYAMLGDEFFRANTSMRYNLSLLQRSNVTGPKVASVVKDLLGAVERLNSSISMLSHDPQKAAIMQSFMGKFWGETLHVTFASSIKGM